jgi:hypothetical protein
MLPSRMIYKLFRTHKIFDVSFFTGTGTGSLFSIHFVIGCVKNYEPENEKSYDEFSAWLRCYNVEGMNNLEAGLTLQIAPFPCLIFSIIYYGLDPGS